MKRIMLTFVLAIAAGVWMTNEATGRWCMPSIRTETEPWIEVNGTFQAEGFPCEPGEPCANCLTIVLVTSNKTYYLVTDDGQLIEYLDTIQLGTKATVTGIPFTRGSYDYIQVSHIETDQKLPSLCDEWNVLQFRSHMGASPDEYYTQHYRLTSDTVINGQIFRKLYKENSYSGAMREGTNRDIYYVPADSTHEYLLYAFNAQVGDTLSNLWVEGYPQEAFMETYADGWTMIVREIQETTPRTYALSYICSVCSYPYYNKSIVWLEGVGYQAGPIGSDTPFDFEIFTPQLLCAYKNGEQVYVSDWGEQYGCEYNYNPYETPTDTIPLFIKDGPGSSTVEPVDPNLIYATLTKDVLSVYAKEKTEISFVLYKAPKTNQVPATKRTIKSASFIGSLSTTLTESGTYTMELTNPAWGYTVFGTFEYKVPQAVENTPADTPSATKILKDGQLLFLYEGKMYNVQGQQVQ